MSRIDAIEKTGLAEGSFDDSYAKLQAVESVVGLISDMAVVTDMPSLQLPDHAELLAPYQNGSPVLRRRFDAESNRMAVIAHCGAQALLQLKSEGRENLQAAARRLMQEIQQCKGQLLVLLNR